MEDIIVSTLDDEQWHCTKKHGKRNPEKKCDHPSHTFQHACQMAKTSPRQSADLLLELFHKDDPRILGLRHICLWEYISTFLRDHCLYLESDAVVLKAIELDKTKHLYYQIMALYSKGVISSHQCKIYESATKLYRVWSLCDEARQMGLTEDPQSNDDNGISMVNSNAKKGIRFVPIAPLAGSLDTTINTIHALGKVSIIGAMLTYME
ncbi:hypothetical protein HDU76_009427, partial [Blyttiomyces sp. JEL0837]